MDVLFYFKLKLKFVWVFLAEHIQLCFKFQEFIFQMKTVKKLMFLSHFNTFLNMFFFSFKNPGTKFLWH